MSKMTQTKHKTEINSKQGEVIWVRVW